MATPSTPPSRNLPLDNPVEPIIISGAPPPPPIAPLLNDSLENHVAPTTPLFDNPIGYHFPSSQSPSSMSLADVRSKTLRALLEGYRSLDVPTLLAPLAPEFTHEVLPQSLNMPVRGRDDFAHHAGMVFSTFKSFEMKPMGLWEDPDREEVILRCAMEGVLKAKKPESEGEKDVSDAKDGQVEVIPSVEADSDSTYNANSSPDLLPTHLSDDIPGDLDLSSSTADPDQPPLGLGTALSPITEVTEPPSEHEEIPSYSSLPPPYFDLTNLCFQIRDRQYQALPPVSSPTLLSQPPNTPMSSRPASPPPASFPLPPPAHQDAPEELPPSTELSASREETTEIHWTNECLLIITFVPSGSKIAKIQEFVDSAKAREMMEKHAPKGFDSSASSESFSTNTSEAPAPPPLSYKPATYLDLDSLILKDASMPVTSVTVTELPPSPVQSLASSLASGTSPRPTFVGLDEVVDKVDKAVQCSLPGLENPDAFDGDALSTNTEYPSLGFNSLCLFPVAWHHIDGPGSYDGEQASSSSSSGSGSGSSSSSGEDMNVHGHVLQGIGQNASAILHRLRKTGRRRIKRLRFSEQVEDIAFSSGFSSSHSSIEGEAGSFSDSGTFFDDLRLEEEGGKETQTGCTWESTCSKIADAVEVLREFVPSPFMPVDLDKQTREVRMKSGWMSGGMFVVGLAVGVLYDRRGRR